MLAVLAGIGVAVLAGIGVRIMHQCLHVYICICTYIHTFIYTYMKSCASLDESMATFTAYTTQQSILKHMFSDDYPEIFI